MAKFDFRLAPGVVARQSIHDSFLFKSTCAGRAVKGSFKMNELILWAGAAILIIGIPVLLARKPQA